MTEYLTINELAARIKFSRQSIYNLIYKKVLVQQTHYFKPSPRKLLFKWSAMKDWIEGKESDGIDMIAKTPSIQAPDTPTTRPPESQIKI